MIRQSAVKEKLRACNAHKAPTEMPISLMRDVTSPEITADMPVSLLINPNKVGRAVTEFLALVDINHRRLEIFVARMRFDLLDRSTGFDRQRAAGMTKRVGANFVG